MILRSAHIIQQKPTYVISDLHIGDGSKKDNFCSNDRENLFYKLLDHVEKQNGEIIFTGDLFEFWRFKPEQIIEKRRYLLDRLNEMDVSYIPGNHDIAALKLCEEENLIHPFFKKTRRPFLKKINKTKFKFMHGHELDPFITDTFNNCGRILNVFAKVVDLRPNSCILASDVFSDIVLEAGERILHVWKTLTNEMNEAMQHFRTLMPNNQVNYLLRGIRTYKMLSRYYKDKQQGLYDIAVVGHTHKAGIFDNWYFNSGSWTGTMNNFLLIQPDGNIEPYDWTECGPRANNTIITC